MGIAYGNCGVDIFSRRGAGMNKYSSLNVLNRKNYMTDDVIGDVANIINAKGRNRSQRRRLEKSLGKVETIMAHAQKHLDYKAYEEYQKAVDSNYIHFFACLGMTMIEDYNWKESEDNEHGQIMSLFERVNKKIVKYSNMGYNTEDIVDRLEEVTGIKLIPDAH